MIVLAVAVALAMATPAGGCEVDDAQLTWGFKESFRSYISSTIANGEWTVADGASYETPDFGWTSGTGSYADAVGELNFAGSITFTGHGGILHTTVANPTIRLDGDTGLLYLDVAGTTQQGAAIEKSAVPFVRLDLGAATVTRSPGGGVSIADAPATLTADGAEAFGTYESGERLDPISVTFSTGEGCVATPAPAWLFGAVAVAGAIVAAIVILLLRRRRQAA
jgi:hypothetical protein